MIKYILLVAMFLMALAPTPIVLEANNGVDGEVYIIPWRRGLQYDYYLYYNGKNYVEFERPVWDTEYLEKTYGIEFAEIHSPENVPYSEFLEESVWQSFIADRVREALRKIVEKYRDRGILGLGLSFRGPITWSVGIHGVNDTGFLASLRDELLGEAVRIINNSGYRYRKYEMIVVFGELPANVTGPLLSETLYDAFIRVDQIFAACVSPQYYYRGGNLTYITSFPKSRFTPEELAQACGELPAMMEWFRDNMVPLRYGYSLFIFRGSLGIGLYIPNASQFPQEEVNELIKWLRRWVLPDSRVPLYLWFNSGTRLPSSTGVLVQEHQEQSLSLIEPQTGTRISSNLGTQSSSQPNSFTGKSVKIADPTIFALIIAATITAVWLARLRKR